jgi:hypothetical protein
MKRLCVLVFVLMIAGYSFAQNKSSPLFKSENVIWAGIDFSMVKMIGPDFNDTSAIFPGMLNAWNDLFLKERISKLESALSKKVILDTEGVYAINKKATPNQIFISPGPDDSIDKTHITEQDIAKAVRSLKLKSTSGLGLVYIVDRFVKADKKGAVYVVYFDVATKEILSSKRQVNGASGFGFRNFWFRTIKDVSPEF